MFFVFLKIHTCCIWYRWKTEDINPSYGKNDTKVYHIVGDLKPYTMYAVYVETYMISGANTGAMSDIVYFRTRPKGRQIDWSGVFFRSAFACSLNVEAILWYVVEFLALKFFHSLIMRHSCC